jgi:hypothetical protein
MPAEFVGLHSSIASGGGGPLVVTVDVGAVIVGGVPPVAGGSVSTDVFIGAVNPVPPAPIVALPPPLPDGAAGAPAASFAVILLPPLFAEQAVETTREIAATRALVPCALIPSFPSPESLQTTPQGSDHRRPRANHSSRITQWIGDQRILGVAYQLQTSVNVPILTTKCPTATPRPSSAMIRHGHPYLVAGLNGSVSTAAMSSAAK